MKNIIFIVMLMCCTTTAFTKAYNKERDFSVNNVIMSDSTEFKDYLGNYKMAENPIAEKMKIIFKDGDLYGQVTGYPALKLTRKKDDEFEESNFGASITFNRVNGIVSGVKISVQGQELFGTKE